MFDQKQAKVTDSQLICYMHSVFDSSASRDNFSKGCAVQDNTGLVKLIRARARILIADWEQHVRAFNLTGYNGSNACGVCSNVLGRCRPFERSRTLPPIRRFVIVGPLGLATASHEVQVVEFLGDEILYVVFTLRHDREADGMGWSLTPRAGWSLTRSQSRA